MESKPNPVKILGVLITRNQWPLVGLCITHVLTNHVDHLIVVDHASTDQTKSGLRELQNHWGSRLEVLHMSDGIFFHEEVNLVLKSFYEERDFDWVYLVDSDEFLITKNEAPLREPLTEVPKEIDLIRYNVVNFVAPVDFDENRLDRYSELTQRSVCDPNLFWDKSNPFEASVKGDINFFQVPFDSKVIFRLPTNAWPTAGAHSLNGIEDVKEKKIAEDYVFAAHLPFLTRERLQRRAEHGRDMVAAGYTVNFAWQSQVVHEFRLQNRLDDYWEQVSIPANGVSKFFQTTSDLRLSKLLKSAVVHFEPVAKLMSKDQENRETPDAPVLNVKHAVAAIRTVSKFQQRLNQVALQEFRDYADTFERIKVENQSIKEANAILNAENAAVKEANASIKAENEVTKSENAGIKRSISWRSTKILRIIHARLNTFKRKT